jgi:hypothetical protein
MGATIRVSSPKRSPGGHRWYRLGEIEALRVALHQGLSISSAVASARVALAADVDSLVGGLLSYDRERADHAIETTLALRSVARSVEEILLPELERIVTRLGADSAAWAFSARRAVEWLRRAMRLAPPSLGRTAIVLADASRDELDHDAAYIHVLKLFYLRAGVKVLMLPAHATSGIGDAALVRRPDVVVLAGKHVDEATITRWTRATGHAIGPRPVARYRHGPTRTHHAVLPPAPGDAQQRLRDLEGATVHATVQLLAS